jgi:type II secretory pathway pseudopilin PulG
MGTRETANAREGEGGFSVVENLVALAILSVVMMSVSNLVIYSMHSNGSVRRFSALLADVHRRIDEYRSAPYKNLLDRFDTPTYSEIAAGQTATESYSSSKLRADYLVTFTAIKSSTSAAPEAVQVRVEARQRRGRLGAADYRYETIISQVN